MAPAARRYFLVLMEPTGLLGSHSDVNEASRQRASAPPAEDTEGFGAFYRREHHQVVRLAWLLTGSQPVAEGVVQDAMTAVYRVFGRVATPSAYLRRAVINTARSWHRDE